MNLEMFSLSGRMRFSLPYNGDFFAIAVAFF